MSSLIRIQRLESQARAEFERGRYKKAEAILLKALTLADTAHGTEPYEKAPLLNLLGIVYKYKGEYDNASDAYRKCLRILQRRSPAEADLSLATLYHNLGGLEHSRGRWALAERYARKGLAIRSQALPPSHPDVAEDLAALAAILHERRKYQEAEALYLQVLTIFRKLARRQAQYKYDVAVNLNNLAATYALLGRTAEAEKSYLNALKLKERILGYDHPDVGMTLNNLAALYAQEKKFKRAERLQLRCLDLFRKTLGEQHPRYLAALRNYEKTQRQSRS